jgi:hypothetical protein
MKNEENDYLYSESIQNKIKDLKNQSKQKN